MTAVNDVRAHAGVALTPARRRFALFALALGGFGIGSSEFVTMGLLPEIASGLLPEMMATRPDVGLARAGWAISAYAVGVVIGAPLLSLLAVRLSRARLIVVFATLLAVSTLASGIMPSFELTIAARFLAGLPHGAYLGVAALLASTLMGPGSQGKGAALAMSGLTVANLAGVPLLTALGHTAGWRAAFLAIAAVFALTAALVAVSIPAQPSPQGRGLGDELRAFKRVQLWAVMAIAAVGFAGSFAVFSYIADIGRQVAGVSASYIPVLLAIAGLGMTIGNAVGGVATDRSLNGTLLIGFPLYIVALTTMIFVVTSPIGLTVTFFMANLAHATLSPAMQTWLMRIAGRSEMLGASLHHAAFNVANALGALLGGSVIAAGFGLAAPTVIGTVVATVGFAMLLAVLALLRIRSRRRLTQLREAQILHTEREHVAVCG
ncbi:MAG TPA: MFS transporter [Candidatus Brachybacterium merdavium]|uniref:MFS transporter n=1 Tax=Candidatus Brachybacterium merdavium TaxID=2838513 RepID=A0A9D2LD56_9MICO|nr:MFS transporter [Candidatus Brachybacterium merdavium]